MNLPISEIFYSLQGEGARTGTANVFVRIQGCKAKNACYAMGIKCDTEFESGVDMSLDDLLGAIERVGGRCKNIVWTGGEPADRVKGDVVAFFKARGFYQTIETSGLFPVDDGIDFVSVAPKGAEHVVKKNFKHVDELRYVRHKGQAIPEPSITADYLYLSPHFDGYDINTDNLKHCMDLCLANPLWRLSVQDHKLWNIL